MVMLPHPARSDARTVCENGLPCLTTGPYRQGVITLKTPLVEDLPSVIDVVASWQRDGLPVQVHPGDLGWYERFGADALASALRVWSRDGDVVAVGFLDESELIRMAVAPTADDDEILARRIADDFVGALDEVLPSGRGVVEARFGPALRHELTDRGWPAGDPWTPLRRDLSPPVPASSLLVRVTGPESIADRISVEAAAFPRSSLSAQRWRQLAGGHAYRNARCLVGYDSTGEAVATTTVWSAGPGRPGLIEPLGVHRDHRGHGHGVAMTLAAAAALRELGASSTLVATPSSNRAAVATYKAAGFVADSEDRDFGRPDC